MPDNPAFMPPSDLAWLGLHGFGRNPGDNIQPRRDGANVDRLPRSDDDDFEPYTAMPGMGALPIAARPVR